MMRTDWIMAVAFAALATGCAYPQGLTLRRPFLVMDIKAGPEETRDTCFPVGVLHYGDYWKSAPFRGGVAAWIQYKVGAVEHLVNITPTAAGSHVEAFRESGRDNEII